MLKSFPEPLVKEFRDAEAETTIATLKTVVEAIRNFRGENNISPKTDFKVGYSTTSSATDAFFKLHAPDIQAMARVSSFAKAVGASTGAEAVIPLSTPPVELRIQLAGLVNVDEESKRIQKEMEKLDGDIQFVRNKLSQDTFKAKAPPELVAKEQKREQELLAKKAELQTSMDRLQKLAK
jgi:valyl-tRNA synthetase